MKCNWGIILSKTLSRLWVYTLQNLFAVLSRFICIILLRHTIYTSKLFLTSNEDFRDRHLSYWSSSHFFEDETTNHLERKEKSFIQYWFLHIPHYNIYQLILSVRFSHYVLLECVQYSVFFALSLCLVNIKSQVREYQKNKKKHWFS